MKIKRIVVSSLIAAGCALSLALTASAAADGEVPQNQVTLRGYVSGVNWPWPIFDRIYYTASISGQNVNLIMPESVSGGDNNKVYVEPMADDRVLKRIYLWSGETRVQQNDLEKGDSCGGSVTQVKLYMWNQGKYDLISSGLN